MNEFRVDVDQVLAAADRLDRIDGAALNAETTKRVVDVAREYDRQVRRDMNAGIALSDEYVSSRMTFEAAEGVPRVVISAAGPDTPGRRGLTILGHYDPKVVTVQASSRARGDAKRGVPAGQRASGVQVSPTRGNPKVIPRAFTMTLRQGTRAGDKTGVFIREGDRLKHLYGVSPYSLFRHQIQRTEQALRDRVQAAALAAIDSVVAA